MGFVIAVDGPAASGKGTIAHRLGEAYGYPVLDSGLLYRALGQHAHADGADIAAAIALTLDPAELERPEVRTRRAGEAASRVAVHHGVRIALREFQQSFAAQEPGAVIDGRDIGTVIAPDADVKLFVTASIEARAQRRREEMRERGDDRSLTEIEADLRRRDERDRTRTEAPLRAAEDAVVLDTSELGRDEAIAAAIGAVEAKLARR